LKCIDTPVFILSQLGWKDKIEGPALIIDPDTYSTIVVEPGCTAQITLYGHVKMDIQSSKKRKIGFVTVISSWWPDFVLEHIKIRLHSQSSQIDSCR